MAKQSPPQQPTSASLLTTKEKATCQRLAKLNIDLISQRAEALLLLDQGHTQTEAAQQTGLTLGQLRYLCSRYRQKKMAIFPDSLLNQKVEEETEPSGKKTVTQTRTSDQAPAATKSSTTKKGKKMKKAKKKDKKKEEKQKDKKEVKKKDKKDKKDKKKKAGTKKKKKK